MWHPMFSEEGKAADVLCAPAGHVGPWGTPASSLPRDDCETGRCLVSSQQYWNCRKQVLFHFSQGRKEVKVYGPLSNMLEYGDPAVFLSRMHL